MSAGSLVKVRGRGVCCVLRLLAGGRALVLDGLGRHWIVKGGAA